MRLFKKNKYFTLEDIQKAEVLKTKFFNGEYRPKLLSNGNLKLSVNVAIWNMPSGVTCRYNCKNCYAKKAERLYKNTRIQRAFHYLVIKEALQDTIKKEYFVNYLINEVRYYNQIYKNFVVRIHEAGDFYSKEYLNLWLDIITRCNDIKFYTYTKQLTAKEIDELNKNYTNLNIIHSMIDDKFINYGDDNYIEGLEKYLQAKNIQYYVCDYGNENASKCMGNCTACLHCPNVLFKQH